MRTTEKAGLWVVYKRTLNKNLGQMNVVCTQAEWDDLERAQPGYHTLVRSGITTEGEAERLARGSSGDPPKRRS